MYQVSLRDAVGIVDDCCYSLDDHVRLSAEFARHLCREANLTLNELEVIERIAAALLNDLARAETILRAWPSSFEYGPKTGNYSGFLFAAIERGSGHQRKALGLHTERFVKR